MIVPSTDGVEIAVHDLGGVGPRLLISHATGFHGRCYEPLANALAGRMHSIAFDYRGHGDTPRPPGGVDWPRYGDDAEAMAVWLVERNNGEPIDAFGHSMGGACLLMAAHRRPTLFRRLVLFEPIVYPPQGIRPNSHANNDTGDNPMVAGARRRRSTFPSYQAAIDNFAAKPPLNGFTPAALRAYVLHGFAEDADGVHLKCRPDTEASTFEMGSQHDTYERLPEIHTEVLVVSGKVEEFQPSAIARQVADRLPNGRYLQLDELDHFGPMVRPDLMADVITQPSREVESSRT
jgi:pimeloyl-ACP methyl ester carboxylesterase